MSAGKVPRHVTVLMMRSVFLHVMTASLLHLMRETLDCATSCNGSACLPSGWTESHGGSAAALAHIVHKGPLVFG